MRADHATEFDSYLVEDVILTLANVRAALGWLIGANAEMQRVGLDRINRQIAALEERALAERRRLPDRVAPVAGVTRPVALDELANIFTDEADGERVEDVLAAARALGDEIAALPMFRTSRRPD